MKKINLFNWLFKKEKSPSVNDMLVDDVIHHSVFKKEVAKVQKEILQSANSTITHGGRINKNLKILIDSGYFTGTGKFIDEYRLILMKVSALPNAQRDALGAIGDKAFTKSVEKLQKE